MSDLYENLVINGYEYEDTVGDDSKSNKKSITVDGNKKQLYAGNYVKVQKYVPAKEIDFDNIDSIRFRAFKQFNTKYNPEDPKTYKYKGRLYPLFITKENDYITVGKWYKCGQGELKIKVDDCGMPVQGSSLKVGSKLGNLAFRPGWHLASLPLTRHIGKGKSKYIDENGNEVTNENDYDYMYSQSVWALVEYSAHYDYTEEASKKPGASTDKKKACFTNRKEFENGFYHYKTNTNADDSEDWLIADAIKVIGVLTDDEVKEIVGEKAQKRWLADGSERCEFMADLSQFEI